jgi:hypothetical protein
MHQKKHKGEIYESTLLFVLVTQASYLVTTSSSLIVRAVESASVVVTHTVPTLDFFSQSLEREYFEGSEGAEGVLDHQVHFSVSQLETGIITACKWEPELQA